MISNSDQIAREQCAARATASSNEILPKEGSIRNKQGLNLVTYEWTVPNPKGAILCVHGYGSFALWEFGRFPVCGYEKSTIAMLNNQGLNVYSYDMQGFGKSDGHEGMRAYVNEFSDYVDDAILMYNKIKEETKLPTYILGQSLGGCVSTHAAIKLGKECPGVILFAPMLSLEENKKNNRLVLALLPIVNWIMPWLQVGTPAENPHYPEMKEKFHEHELSYSGLLRARLGVEFLKAVDEARENAHKIECPALFLHSKRDTMCEPDGSVYVHERISSEKKKLVLFSADEDDLWHALTVEPDNHKVFAHVAEFLQELIPST